jgi:hypothetical protein
MSGTVNVSPFDPPTWGPIPGPMYVAGGWFQMPVFPSYWYHPVLAPRLCSTASDFLALDGSWSPTAGLADMRRTEEEAAQVIMQDRINTAATATQPALASGVLATGTNNNRWNRRSAAWEAVIRGGWARQGTGGISPFSGAIVPAQTPIGGPAPVVEGRSPGVTPPPGSSTGATEQARSEQVAPAPEATATSPTSPLPSPMSAGAQHAQGGTEPGPTGGSGGSSSAGEHHSGSRRK